MATRSAADDDFASVIVEIGPDDREWHPRWCRYVRAVFPRAGFERWVDWGEWGPDYLALALVRNDEIQAGVGLTRMTLLLDGVPRKAWQLGAVGCVPGARGCGNANAVMRAALERIGSSPALLYANPSVMDFYPRFGFAHQIESAFHADYLVSPQGPVFPVADWQDPQIRSLVHELSAHGVPATERFGARDYGRIITWYAANGFSRPLRQLAPRTLVVAGVVGETLYVDEILTDQAFDLETALPRLIDAPVQRIQFGFAPERLWPMQCHVVPDDSGCLFARGFTPPATSRFPELAHT